MRQQLKKKRQQLSEPAREQAAAAVSSLVSQTTAWKNAQHIALYNAHGGELDPAPLQQLAQAQDKCCYLPIIQGPQQALLFAPIHHNSIMRRNRFGIAEPQVNAKELRSAENLDFACIPLLGFDRMGNRLGMGGGYYES